MKLYQIVVRIIYGVHVKKAKLYLKIFKRARDGTGSVKLTRDPTRPDPNDFDPVTQ